MLLSCMVLPNAFFMGKVYCVACCGCTHRVFVLVAIYIVLTSQFVIAIASYIATYICLRSTAVPKKFVPKRKLIGYNDPWYKLFFNYLLGLRDN